MYQLLLDETIKDYYFYESEENIDALETYCECIENNKDCSLLEEHIFETLEIYLEQVYPIFEVVVNFKSDPKKKREEEERIKRQIKGEERVFNVKKKGLIGKLRGKLGVSSLRQEVVDSVHRVKNKFKKKLKKQGIKVRKQFKTTDLGKKITKAVSAGVHASVKKIRQETRKRDQLRKKWEKDKLSKSPNESKSRRAYFQSKHRLDMLRRKKLPRKALHTFNRRRKR